MELVGVTVLVGVIELVGDTVGVIELVGVIVGVIVLVAVIEGVGETVGVGVNDAGIQALP